MDEENTKFLPGLDCPVLTDGMTGGYPMDVVVPEVAIVKRSSSISSWLYS